MLINPRSLCCTWSPLLLFRSTSPNLLVHTPLSAPALLALPPSVSFHSHLILDKFTILSIPQACKFSVIRLFPPFLFWLLTQVLPVYLHSPSSIHPYGLHAQTAIPPCQPSLNNMYSLNNIYSKVVMFWQRHSACPFIAVYRVETSPCSWGCNAHTLTYANNPNNLCATDAWMIWAGVIARSSDKCRRRPLKFQSTCTPTWSQDLLI